MKKCFSHNHHYPGCQTQVCFFFFSEKFFAKLFCFVYYKPQKNAMSDITAVGTNTFSYQPLFRSIFTISCGKHGKSDLSILQLFQVAKAVICPNVPSVFESLGWVHST